MSIIQSFSSRLPQLRASAPASWAGLRRSFATADEDKSVLEQAKEKVGEYVKKAGQIFEEDGAVGKQFTPEGAAGGAAQKTAKKTGAESLDAEGSVGKTFTTDGAVGGNVQEAAEKVKNKGKQLEGEGGAGSSDVGASTEGRPTAGHPTTDATNAKLNVSGPYDIAATVAARETVASMQRAEENAKDRLIPDKE